MNMTDKKRLGHHVTVGGDTYGPLDDLPDEIAEQITNPNAWERTPATEAAEALEAKARRKSGTYSGARLATTVTVGGDTYGPLDELPDEIAAQITNPNAWEGGKLPRDSKVTAKAAEEGPGKGPTDPATDGDGPAPADPEKPRKTATAAKRS